MKKLFRIFFLPYQKKKLLLQSMVLVWMIRLSLWIFPYRRLSKWLSYLGSDKFDNQGTDWVVIKEIVRCVSACARYVPSASCLTQALAAQTLLRLRGQNSRLRIGVDKDENNKLIAHAWIEIDGKIVIGKLPDIRRYSILSHGKEQVI